MEEKKPTIENPFSRTPRKSTLFKPEPETPSLFKPPYYVSQATLNFLAKKIEANELTIDELPVVHKLSLLIGKALGRATPTVSDVEIAVMYRTLEHTQKIATGEETIDQIRHTMQQEVMPRKDRIEFWKLLAQRIVEDYET